MAEVFGLARDAHLRGRVPQAGDADGGVEQQPGGDVQRALALELQQAVEQVGDVAQVVEEVADAFAQEFWGDVGVAMHHRQEHPLVEAVVEVVQACLPGPAVARLKTLFESTEHCYGSRRLLSALRSEGMSIGRFKVRRLMKQQGLRPIWKRKFVHTTNSNHNLPVAENLLNRQFNPEAINQSWVSDITYIRTRSGWVYLAAVMDLFSRKIVGWAMAPHMRAELVISAMQLAIAQRQPEPGLIAHSDRGSQYAGAVYQALQHESKG